MILECPICETRYESPGELPPGGRKVRCASCLHVWLATQAVTPEQSSVLDDIDSDEIVFQDVDPEAGAERDAPEAASGTREDAGDSGESATGELSEDDAGDAETDAAGDEFSEHAMEQAFSAAVQEAQAAKDAGAPASTGGEDEAEDEAEAESPPIVIGKARKRGGAGIGDVRAAAGWAGLAIMLAGVAAGAYFQRVSVVRALPGAASAYARIGLPVNVRGLAFEKVRYSWEESAGHPVLEVSGEIVNVTAQPLKVPTVVFGLRTKEKVEVYQWAADVRTELLPAGARTAFNAQIPTPPKSIRDVQVRFAKVR